MDIFTNLAGAWGEQSRKPKKSRAEKNNEILQWLIAVPTKQFGIAMTLMTAFGIALTFALLPLGIVSLVVTWVFGIRAMLYR